MSSPVCLSDETISLAHDKPVTKGPLCKECEPMSFVSYVKAGATPVLPIGAAVTILFCNIVLPGIGTMFSAIAPSAKANRRTILSIGLLQFFGAPLIFPYCWALFYGAQLISHSKMHQVEDQLAAQRATDAYRLEQEVRARDALLHVKDSELESSKRLQDALARENYDSKRRCEDAERESRAAKSDLMREINDRAERARSRLQILERRALEEDLVSNNVDHIYALTSNANNRSVSNSALNYSQYNSGLGASNRPPIHSIASPIAVSRASGNMSKEQIRSLITNIDRSLVGN